MKLAAEAGVLEMAADAAETIQPKNSLERMLSHELAGAHCGAMKLLNRALDPARRARWVHSYYSSQARLARRRDRGNVEEQLRRLMGAVNQFLAQNHLNAPGQDPR